MFTSKTQIMINLTKNDQHDQHKLILKRRLEIMVQYNTSLGRDSLLVTIMQGVIRSCKAMMI